MRVPIVASYLGKEYEVFSADLDRLTAQGWPKLKAALDDEAKRSRAVIALFDQHQSERAFSAFVNEATDE